MRIALITDGISPYVLGGMQRHSFYLVKYFAKFKIHVDLFHFNQSNLNIDKLDCFSDEEKKYIKSTIINFPKKRSFPGHYVYESYQYSKHIFDIIKDDLNKYDFIYCKGFTGWKLLNEKVKGTKMPLIGMNAHGYEMFQKPPDFKTIPSLFLLRFFIKPLLLKSDLVFSYGGKVTTLLVDKVKISRERIVEISGGIEKNWINESEKSVGDPVKFVFLGRAERRKGIEELNEVLNRIKDKINFRFTFIGPIPDKLRIEHPNIQYLGEIREVENLKKKLYEQNVLVCPSHSEGMPNVILEAMANQLAIIATDVGAVSMMVGPENGILIKHLSIQNLENALKDMCMLNKSKLGELQKESLYKVKSKFLWDEVIKSHIAKIENQLVSPDFIRE